MSVSIAAYDAALLFWNGQAIDAAALTPVGKFKAAQIHFQGVAAITVTPLRRWLKKAGTDLWDYRSATGRLTTRPAGS